MFTNKKTKAVEALVFFVFFNSKYFCIEVAASLPSLIAHTTKDAPLTISPAAKIPGILVYGDHSKDDVSGVVSFLHESLHAEDLAHMLDSMGIAVRTGHHCAQPLMRKLGVVATNRASFYFYNTMEESVAFVNAVRKIVERFA